MKQNPLFHKHMNWSLAGFEILKIALKWNEMFCQLNIWSRYK